MSEGAVRYAVGDGVASVVFDRPEARNAMTWAMYEELAAVVAAIAVEPQSGSPYSGAPAAPSSPGPISANSTAFAGADDGIAYERRIEAAIAAIERLPMPTLAVVRGPAMGGGLMIATACDFRFATPDARFAVPIARTVGNCLSMANMARLLAAFGPATTRRMLLLADTMGAPKRHVLVASC